MKNFRNEPIHDPWKNPEEIKSLLSGIEEARKILHQPKKVLVGEQWIDGDHGEYCNVNPNNREEKYGPFTTSSLSQAEKALEFAKKIQPAWGAKPFAERSKALRKI
ncbi:MAG: aldehyde dehydrogenase family protein, partial [Deltaproteobacteria bacterium]|nr:aldehyde dehydrogenase family protein [Deltaproteobacteria bacterium]